MTKQTNALIILDGWGWREEREDNAVLLANTPNFDRLWQSCPHAFLTTHGAAVGLPEGQMGNSEVGHLNIGAGRIVMQELPRIDADIRTGTFETRVLETGIVDKMKQSGGTCHIMGLISPGGVHAHQDHAAALAKVLTDAGLKVVIHAFTDGRDTPPKSADEDLKRLEAALPAGVKITTVSGRYYAMDRDKRWERVEKAYLAMVEAQGENAGTAQEAIAQSYSQDKTDEFILPTVIGDYQGMQDGDAILCTNFRSDRAREILTTLLDEDFDGFERRRNVNLSAAIAMVAYSAELEEKMQVLFPPQSLSDGLSETLAKAGKTQIHMAETEKYPHVTYFLNGGEEKPFDGEERVMVASPKVATYDLKPEMSAPELKDKALDAIRSGTFDFMVINFANPDMVGHTGDLQAAIKAVETVDDALGALIQAIQETGGFALVTADHGNCEVMRDPETGGPHTAHTLNPVPIMLVGKQGWNLQDGKLGDIAPTLLTLMDLDIPDAMTGRILVIEP
jgi:2,3-bisphosphoglycerate-independent phosphoglycerate mutase